MTTKFIVQHDKIRKIIQEHGGIPARIRTIPEEERTDTVNGMLSVSFDQINPEFEPISWEEFFDRFEHERLALVYTLPTPPGEAFEFRFVDRDLEQSEYLPATELPDSGDPDMLRENLIPDVEPTTAMQNQDVIDAE
jgi:hypothetical protein